MDARHIIKSLLRNHLASCRKYGVDHDEILAEIRKEEKESGKEKR